MLVNTTCPNCGAQLNMDDSKEQFFCTYCGTKIVNMAQKIEVNQTIQQNIVHSGKIEYKIDHSSDPTLNIHYSTINPQVKMIVNIIDTNQKTVFINGQNMSFRLAPGRHDLVLKIGKINNKRTIYVPEDYTPVSIFASFDGRSRITIDQPDYTIPQIPINNTQPYVNPGTNIQNSPNVMRSNNTVANVRVDADKPKPSWMAIVGFILSFIMYLSPAAIGLCIFDIIKNNGKRPKGLSIAGIIISSFGMIMLFFIIIAGLSGSGNTGTTIVQ